METPHHHTDGIRHDPARQDQGPRSSTLGKGDQKCSPHAARALSAPVLDDHRRRLLETIRASIIGADEAIEVPYGLRRVTYADYTASGRSLSFIEEYLCKEVLPLYANTHTEASGTGLQTTRFREDARRIIRDAVGATSEHVVLFCGSGATSAINKLIHVLNLRLPELLERRYHFRAQIPEAERPVVFIGPYEHHSNELPWRESIVHLVTISEDADGHIDQAHLKAELEHYKERPLLIGSFSAASNVTGVVSDTRAVSILLHQYNALSFWDFAAAGPYMDIGMDARDDGPDGHLNYKDAVFISPHKFIGGPSTPGILVARRELFRNTVPAVPGGGTVQYVNPTEHRYLEDVEHREEGGTPAIIDSIRAGLVFQLKQAVGVDTIRSLERWYIERAIARWSQDPHIHVLGNLDAERLSIVSFMVRHEKGYLHHNFVVAVLNDLFGIQARGGCSCAGPYGHRLLGIDLNTSHEFEQEIVIGFEGLKPGWVRVNFNYFISEREFDFLLEAVLLVAQKGYALLPHYRFDPLTGRWQHARGQVYQPMRLTDLTYESGRLEFRSRRAREPERALKGYLDAARQLLEEAERDPVPENFDFPPLSPHFESLRWFPLPGEGVTGGEEPAQVLETRLSEEPRLRIYYAAVETAYRTGQVSCLEAGVLDGLRRSLGIGPADHWRVIVALRGREAAQAGGSSPS